MKKYLLLSITTLVLMLFTNTIFSQTLDLGSLSTFEAYTGTGAVTNSGEMIGDAGSNDGVISGSGFGLGYSGTTYVNNPTTVQARIDLLRVFIHLDDVFVDYPGSHTATFGSAETLYPGVYSTPGAGSLSGPITLDGLGDPDAYFIIKFDGAFTVAVGTNIILTGGTRAANVFWISGGALQIGKDSFLKGTFISKPGAMTVGTGSTLEGRLLSTEGAITIGAGTVAAMPTGNSTIPINCSGNCSPASEVDVLGSLKQYALFTSSGAVANSATSGIVGDIGTNAGAISGFTTSTHVGSFNIPSAATAQAVADLANAYIQIKLLPNTVTGHLATFGLGETVLPGVYYTAGAGNLAGTITLDAQGDADAIFVFKFNGAFTATAQSKVILKNGARSCNVFWTSEGATDIGTFSHMKGTIIANAGAATMAANGNLEGRLLSTAGAIGFSTGVVYNDSLCFGDDTPISDGDQTACSDGTTTQTLTATATSNTTAGTIVWFDAPTGGTAVSNPTQVGIGSVTYYAASYNGTYYSTDRTAVTLTINNCSIDTDGDGIPDGDDNCPLIANTDQADADNDGIGDVCEDTDGDGIPDVDDNCPLIANTDQADADNNGIGDVCEDTDGDGIPDVDDNCPLIANTDQADADNNGIGDVCEDTDGDGIPDVDDNCPLIANTDQADADNNGIGDVCEDTDGDGIPDVDDNCPLIANTDQADADNNGIGDVCDASGPPNNPTSPAECFSVFVENHVNVTSGSTNGSLAAGGDLTINGNYGVASQDCGCFDINGNQIGLLVGGQVNYTSGILNISNPAQYAQIGTSNGSNAWYLDPLNAPTPIRVTPGSNYNATSHIQLFGNAAAFNASTGTNPVFAQNLIDFSLAFQQLRTNSTSMSENAHNASLEDNAGNTIPNVGLPNAIEIFLNNGVNYLNITGSDLNNVQAFSAQNHPGANKILVINVDAPGAFSWDVWSPAGIAPQDTPYVIYNFYNTTDLQLEGSQTITGTIMAPFADITKTVNTADVLGQIIGTSFTQDGGNIECANFIPEVVDPTPSNAIPTAEFTVKDSDCLTDNVFIFNNMSNTNPSTQPADPISYAWDFGDGTTSTLMNPTKIYNGSGIFNVTLTATNSFGSDTQTKQVNIFNSLNHPTMSYDVLPSVVGVVTREYTIINDLYFDSFSWALGGVGANLFPNQKIVSFNFTAQGLYNLTITGTKNGCSKSITFPIIISSNEVSSGNMGGVESESLGDIISKIYVGRKKNSLPTEFVKSSENLYNKAKLKSAQPFQGKGQTMLDMFPTELIAGNIANITSPTDILDYTVADEVLSVDFSLDGKTKGVVLGIKTSDKIYNHTKASCDRLRGAEVLNIQTVQLEGYNFLMQGIKQRNGVVEFAISFATAKNNNDNSYTIQTNWYVNNYTKFNDVYNFQVWSTNPEDTQKLVTDIIKNLRTFIPVTQTEVQKIPMTYAAKISRDKADLVILLRSTKVGLSTEISMEELYSETANNLKHRYNPVNTALEQEIRVDIKDGYEYDALVKVNGEVEDAFYHSDGNWGLDYDKNYTEVKNYFVSNDFDREYKDDEYAINRNIEIKATSEYDYLTVYKSLLPGTLSADYSEYNYVAFTAKGSGLMELGLIKSSIQDWRAQYRVMVDFSEEEQTYYVPFDVFASTGTLDKMTAEDLTTLAFTFLPVEAQTKELDLTISDVRFTKTAVEGQTIEKIEKFNNEFMAYPNPSQGNVNLLLFSETDTEVMVTLTDITGKVIYRGKTQLTAGKNELEYNFRVKTGVMLLQVNSAEVNYGTSKLIFR